MHQTMGLKGLMCKGQRTGMKVKWRSQGIANVSTTPFIAAPSHCYSVAGNPQSNFLSILPGRLSSNLGFFKAQELVTCLCMRLVEEADTQIWGLAGAKWSGGPMSIPYIAQSKASQVPFCLPYFTLWCEATCKINLGQSQCQLFTFLPCAHNEP